MIIKLYKKTKIGEIAIYDWPVEYVFKKMKEPVELVKTLKEQHDNTQIDIKAVHSKHDLVVWWIRKDLHIGRDDSKEVHNVTTKLGKTASPLEGNTARSESNRRSSADEKDKNQRARDYQSNEN